MKRLSTVQEPIWLTQNIYTGSTLFNVAGYALITGALQESALLKAMDEVLAKADVIEAGYDVLNNEPVGHNRYDIMTMDFSGDQYPDQSCMNWMQADVNMPFPEKTPLLKIVLLKAAENRCYWYVKVHHLIFDGYAMTLLFNHVAALYSAFIVNRPATPELYSYNNFIEEENQYKQSGDFLSDKQFWLDRVREVPDERGFQSCMQTSSRMSMEAGRKEIDIPRALYNKIEELCKKHHCTAFHYFIATIFILNKCYNNETPLIGIPVFNRRNKQFKNTIGTFVNVLPFSIVIEKGSTFTDVLLAVRDELKDCYRHQRFPLHEILEGLDRKGNIFNISFSYQKNIYEAHLGSSPATIHYIPSGEQQEDLMFHLLEYAAGDDLVLAVSYLKDLFTADTASRLLDHFKTLLHVLLNCPTVPVQQLDYITAAEKQQLLADFNDTAAAYPDNTTLVELFAQQAAARPAETALVFNGKKFTYQELDERSGQLSAYLRKRYHILPDDLVGIKLERSERMIISLLGILKSGAAYVPVDPMLPQDRINYILKDSNCKVLIDEEEWAVFDRMAGTFDATDLRLVNRPTDLAYVIYTSGSTGQPKGCMLEHRGVINRIEWMWQQYSFNTTDIILQKTTFTFDVSVWELFMPLCWGAKMVLCQQEDVTSPERLLSLIEKEKVTCLHFVPSMFQAFINAMPDTTDMQGSLSSVRRVITSGEALSPETVQSWYRLTAAPVHNLYGPTEASIDVTYYDTAADDQKIPIGRPIWNTEMYVLGESDQLLPVGVAGELCIAGVGLARGYLNREKLTAERFVAHPFRSGELMYRSGDLGRWLPNGDIEYLGRKDDQVKVRGYRIELGEIETVLQGYAPVDAAVVAVKMNSAGEKDLVAYFVSRENLQASGIRGYLGSYLPEYMIPGHYMQLAELPLTSSGKVNRKQLPEPARATGTRYVAPGTGTEKQLAMLWQQVLGKEKVGIKDNFFDLGGHSLKAMRLAALLYRNFEVRIPVKDLFTATVLEDQARLIANSRRTSFTAIPAAPVQPVYPLSYAQKRLWILSQLEEASAAYNMPGAYLFEGTLDLPSLEQAFNVLITRHESLRTIFTEDEQGTVMQLILSAEAAAFHIACEDLREGNGQQTMVQQRVKEMSVAPFDLFTAPLLRAGLYQIEDHKWVFVFAMHHIISDGWSMQVLVKEVLQLYNAFTSGEGHEPAPLPVQYKDYVMWQQGRLNEAGLLKHRAYWISRFEHPLPVLELPADKPRPAVRTYNGAVVRRIISEHPAQNLRTIAGNQGSTLFMALLAAVKVLLFRYSGQTDIIIGSPIAGRDHIDLEDQIGLYVNTLALRTQFTGTDSYTRLLERVREVTLGAYEHQVYPFDKLVEELDVPLDVSRNALFDVMVVLQDNEAGYLSDLQQLNGLSISTYNDAGDRPGKFDLVFNFTEAGKCIHTDIVYNSDIYTAAMADRLSDHFLQLLEAIVKHPGKAVGELDYLAEAERTQLLQMGNNTLANDVPARSLAALFEEQVAGTPGNVAVVFEDIALTYQELNKKANQLSAWLRKHYQVQANELVGIQLERSEWMIVALLGVLKAGAAYLPIDPGYPQGRIDYILSDSKCKVLLDAQALQQFAGEAHAYADDNPDTVNDTSDVAYVIYTSGSTGQPKGVMVGHGSLISYIYAIGREYGISNSDRILQVSSFAFDASVEQIFLAILNGATLYIARSNEALAGLIERNAITHIHAVPSLLMETDLTHKPALKRVVSAGERFPQSLLQQPDEGVRLYNKYGPTETTISATIFPVNGNGWLCPSVPIGRPVGNSTVYVLDEQQQLLPIGVTGEICIGGQGLAKGYLNQPALTAGRFVPNPFRSGERMYRTGDLGRWLPDGNIEYIGRKDDQVKVRGHRIEPAEIEAALSGYHGIEQAAVIAGVYGEDQELIAYLVSNAPLQAAEIKAFLQKILPAYMIPAFYIQLEGLPRLSNGKIDRKRLPAPGDTALLSGAAYEAPGNDTEERLALIWQEILGKEKIGIRDNFFELGGHSLKATRLAGRIHRTFNVRVPLKDLFINSTLADQALLIMHTQQSRFIPLSASTGRADYPLSSSQRRLWVLSQFEEANVAYNMAGAFRFEGDLNRHALSDAFDTIIARHEILRTVFRENAEEEIRQYILPAEATGFQIGYEDLRDHESLNEQLTNRLQAAFSCPFDLEHGPLLRAGLYQTGDAAWTFTCVMHHIISDGWSMDILVGELLQLYNAYVQGDKTAPLELLRIQYKDFSVWQQEQLHNGALNAHKTYWMQQLSGELPVLDLPADKTRPTVKTYNGSAVSSIIDTAIITKIKKLAEARGGTLFMGLLAAMNAFLYRYTSQEDIIIGSPVAGRGHADLENQIGFYANTLALRTRFRGTDSFHGLLDVVKQVTLDAYTHQAYPFDELVNTLSLRRDASRGALFDVMMVLRHDESTVIMEEQERMGLSVRRYDETHKVSKFDLLFNFAERKGEVKLTIEYNTDIYKEETIARMNAHFRQLLITMAEHPSTAVNGLEFISLKEKEQLLITFNDTAVSFPQNKTITDSFEEQVGRTPDHPALLFEERKLTYRELNEHANRLADYLRKQYNIQPDDLVGIQLERSEWLVISMLGVLKSGAAYVPIDPEYPIERINYILDDSNCRVLIDGYLLQQFREEQDSYSSRNLKRIHSPADLAYVIYTSGTTGRPKGVMIAHSNTQAFIEWCKNEFSASDYEVVLAVTSVCFDLSIFEIFFTLVTGKQLRLLPNALALPQYLSSREKILLNTVPSVVSALLNDHADLCSVTVLNMAGEPVPKSIVAALDCDNMEVRNLYGPSEDTTYSTFYRITNADKILIGRPVSNTCIYILNSGGQLQPAGIAGEICVGGAGLARGYLNKPGLTSEKFVTHPFNAGERIYRTGDLGYWLPDGNIMFMGRKDDQVKIRGYRIELGEIQYALESCPGLTAAVVQARDVAAGDSVLVAYVVGSSPLNVTNIKGHLEKFLPGYMIPTHFVQLGSIPLTPNGKVDKNKLPDHEGRSLVTETTYVAPRNEIEERLAAIWKQLLGNEKIGVKDNFFDVGGHSLKVTQLISRINAVFTIRISMQTIYKEPTIEALSDQISFILTQNRQKQNKQKLTEIEI